MTFKSIDYEYRTIAIAPGKDEQFKDEFIELNPLGQVPAMITEHNGQKINLIQSLAIIRFIEDSYPDAPKLIPNDPITRYKVNSFVDVICSGIQPLQNLAILDKLNKLNKGSGKEWAIEVIEKGFYAIEKLLEQYSNGKFCVGDEFTLADICLVPQVYNARRFNVDLSKFPLIENIEAQLVKHPAIAKSHPSNMPDAEL